MTVPTPAPRAAAMAASPTAPAPNTTRLWSAVGRSTLRTVPAPVWKPQPNGARRARSRSRGTTTQLSAYASACRAKLDWPKNDPNTVSSPRRIVVDPSGRMPM